jgi:hypothetical protein
MSLALKGLEVPREELPLLAERSMVLPAYKNHPKIVSLDEARDILEKSRGFRP